ncbi:MAG: isopenicillin N synthase family dioxygenase [Ilumatobacteraceae bacterium]
MEIPVIDLRDANAPSAIDAACRTTGFFAVTGHGIPSERRTAVIDAARQFFAQPADVKEQIALARGGRAWRGWFPLGDELTSGVPDLKEGLYVGRELPPSERPLHGPNLWPDTVPDLQWAVAWWTAKMESLGQRVLAAMATGLGLAPDWFRSGICADPTVLFRIFRYPPHPVGAADRWGVAEHTDYGLLTLLTHDGTPGLEVNVRGTWVPVDADPDLVICNLGDMLDRLTLGRYRSTPHRVRNAAGHDRISLPFFLDPSWDAVVQPLPLDDDWATPIERSERWDRADLTTIDGTYGDWLVAKVKRVFPQLADVVLADVVLDGGASQ